MSAKLPPVKQNKQSAAQNDAEDSAERERRRRRNLEKQASISKQQQPNPTSAGLALISSANNGRSSSSKISSSKSSAKATKEAEKIAAEAAAAEAAAAAKAAAEAAAAEAAAAEAAAAEAAAAEAAAAEAAAAEAAAAEAAAAEAAAAEAAAAEAAAAEAAAAEAAAAEAAAAEAAAAEAAAAEAAAAEAAAAAAAAEKARTTKSALHLRLSATPLQQQQRKPQTSPSRRPAFRPEVPALDLSSLQQLLEVTPTLASAHLTAATKTLSRLGAQPPSPFHKRLKNFARALKLKGAGDGITFEQPPPPPMDAALLPPETLNVRECTSRARSEARMRFTWSCGVNPLNSNSFFLHVALLDAASVEFRCHFSA
jgi:hypothetical protein